MAFPLEAVYIIPLDTGKVFSHDVQLWVEENRDFLLEACMEVLHIFVCCLKLFSRFYMMHENFYMHDNLNEAENICKSFQSNNQNLKAADNFQIAQNFPCSMINIFMHASKLHVQSKFWYRANLFISRIFYCDPWKVSYATDDSH